MPAAARAHSSVLLPGITENEHGPVHTRQSLYGIISRFNSNDHGQIDALLHASRIGLAFFNVPNSSVFFSSRPLTALLTRWQMCALILVVAMSLLAAVAYDLLTITGSSRRLRGLHVDVEVYENVFPHLAHGNVSENRRLALIDGGVYVNGFDRKYIEGCQTHLTSASSFDIFCAQHIMVHGIWVLVCSGFRV